MELIRMVWVNTTVSVLCDTVCQNVWGCSSQPLDETLTVRECVSSTD